MASLGTRKRLNCTFQNCTASNPKTTAENLGKSINSCSEEVYLHLDSALLTPTVGDHCKENTQGQANINKKGKLTEIRENDTIHNINIIHNI